MIELAVALVALAGPDGQIVYVNPVEVVSVRKPRETALLHAHVKCTLQTVDGRLINVVDECERVIEKLRGEN